MSGARCEVFPLHCPLRDAEMRIIAFITDPPTVRDILSHLGEAITPPHHRPGPRPAAVGSAALLDSIPSEAW